MLKKILNFFRTIFIIFCLLFFTNNAFALKLKLNLKDAIDKVTDEIENKLNDEDNIVNVDSETQLTDKNLIIEIDEDISKVKIQDLKKLKTRDMEKVLFGTVSFGFYENGDTFIDTHHLNKSNEKGQYESNINNDQNFNGVYEIAQSKICYLLNGVDDWQCAWLYKSKKQKNIYYWALKGKVFAKIVNILDISEYELVKSNTSNVKENSEETVVAKKNQEDNKKNTEEVKEEVKTTEEVNVVCKNPEVLVKDNNLHYSYINNTLDLIRAYSIVVKQGDQTIEYIFSGDDDGGKLTLINLRSNESENYTYKLKDDSIYDDDKKIIINDVNMKIESSINEQGEPYVKFWKDGDQNMSTFDIIGFRDQLEKIACENKNSYQVLNENIDSNNQINLVYCKYKENYSVIKDTNNYKKGDNGEFESYYIFTELDKETENNKCPNLDEYNNKRLGKAFKTNTINYNRITAEEFEKHNLDLKLKNNYPLGKNVILKLPNGGNFRYEEKVLEAKDLIKYCLLKNSEEKPWIKPGEPIFTLAWFGEVDDQPGASGGKVWEAGCGDNDGRTSHNTHYSKIIKVSKGKISRNDVPEYIPYHVLFEKAEKEKKAKEERDRIEKENKEAKIKQEIELKNKPEYKLIEAYKDYLILLNQHHKQ